MRPAGEGELATERILEGLARLEKLQNRPDLPVREQMEAAGLRVEAMTRNHGMLRAGDEVVDGLRHSVRAMFSRLDEEQKLGLDLQLRSMDLAIRPEQREQIVREAEQKVKPHENTKGKATLHRTSRTTKQSQETKNSRRTLLTCKNT